MAAKGIRFPRRWYGGMISANLEVIWVMSAKISIDIHNAICGQHSTDWRGLAMRHLLNLRGVVALTFLLTLIGCISPPQPVTDRNSNLTQGNVQLHLEVGSTTKAEVLETFGSPNVTTRDGGGREVWTYQRSAQVSHSSSQSGYWTILIFGQSSDSSGFESTSRMITLIIKFDSDDVVADFKSRTSNF